MTGKAWWLFAAAAAFLLIGVPAWARGMGGGGMGGRRGGVPGGLNNGDPTRGDNPANKKDGGYIVVQAGDAEGKVTFDAIAATDVKSKADELITSYRDALKEWTLQKKDAEKNGEKFTRGKPDKPFLQDYMNKVYQSLKVAKSVAEKCQEKWDKELAKKQDKGGDAKATDEKPGAPPKEEKAVTDRKPVE